MSAETKRFAHICKASKGYILVINDKPYPTDGATVHIASKKAARDMATRFNATPWNF